MCLRISYVGFTFEIQEEMGKRETLSASSFNVCRHSVFKDVSVYVCSLPKLRSLQSVRQFLCSCPCGDRETGTDRTEIEAE